ALRLCKSLRATNKACLDGLPIETVSPVLAIPDDSDESGACPRAATGRTARSGCQRGTCRPGKPALVRSWPRRSPAAADRTARRCRFAEPRFELGKRLDQQHAGSGATLKFLRIGAAVDWICRARAATRVARLPRRNGFPEGRNQRKRRFEKSRANIKGRRSRRGAAVQGPQ